MNAVPLSEEDIAEKAFLAEQNEGMNSKLRQTKEKSSLESQTQINAHNEYCVECHRSDALVLKSYEGILVCKFCGLVAH